MAKRRPRANKPVEAKKPETKPQAQVKKVAIPEGLAATFEACPRVKEAYLFNDGVWRFNKLFAERTKQKFEVVANPHFKE